MTRRSRALIVATCAAIALAGCSQGKSGPTVGSTAAPTGLPVAGSPFVGEWAHHGGTLTIRGDDTATQISRYDTWCAGPGEPCFLEYTLRVRLTEDKQTAVAVVSAQRVVVYSSPSTVTEVPSPTWGADGPPSSSVGRTSHLKFVAPKMLHDVEPPQDGSYWCKPGDPSWNYDRCGL
jgi:hypothetical protein